MLPYYGKYLKIRLNCFKLFRHGQPRVLNFTTILKKSLLVTVITSKLKISCKIYETLGEARMKTVFCFVLELNQEIFRFGKQNKNLMAQGLVFKLTR